jgi:hypothetical protein
MEIIPLAGVYMLENSPRPLSLGGWGIYEKVEEKRGEGIRKKREERE